MPCIELNNPERPTDLFSKENVELMAEWRVGEAKMTGYLARLTPCQPVLTSSKGNERTNHPLQPSNPNMSLDDKTEMS